MKYGWRHTASAVAFITKKPRSRPMPAHIAQGKRTNSHIRAKVKHVYAEQTPHMKLFVRTFGIRLAEAMMTLANMAVA